MEAQETRGVGIYPGNPAEDFAPSLVPEVSAYRNLALHRPAYHSSSYDYNLTAQLVTDGIKETRLPRWLATSTSQDGPAGKIEREFMLDGNATSSADLDGPKVWVQFEFAGGEAPFQFDRVALEARVRSKNASFNFVGQGKTPGKPPKAEFIKGDWICVVMGSEDGKTWQELGRARETMPPPPTPPKESPFPGFLAWFASRGTTINPAV